MNILLIDDEKVFTDYISLHLSHSHNVHIFNNSLDALEHFKEDQDYDLIIIDYIMPDLQGDQLIEQICELKPHQEIIVSSGDLNTERCKKMTELNNTIKFISKPFDLLELDNLISKIFEQKLEK